MYAMQASVSNKTGAQMSECSAQHSMQCLTCKSHVQGETAQEMAGLAEAMQTKAVPVHTSCDGTPLCLPAADML